MKKLFLLSFLFGYCLLSVQAQGNKADFRLELSTKRNFLLYDQLTVAPDFGTNITQKLINYSFSLSGYWSIDQQMEVGAGLGMSNRDFYGRCYCYSCFKIFTDPLYTKRRSIDMLFNFRFKWRKPEKKFNPYLSVGLVSSIPLKYTERDGESRVSLDTSLFTIGGTLGLGNTWAISDRLTLVTGAGVKEHKYFEASNDGIEQDIFRTIGLDEWYLEVGLSFRTTRATDSF